MYRPLVGGGRVNVGGGRHRPTDRRHEMARLWLQHRLSLLLLQLLRHGLSLRLLLHQQLRRRRPLLLQLLRY